MDTPRMDMMVTKSKHGLNLWGAEILLEGKRYTIGGAAKTEIEGAYIKQWWILLEEGGGET